MKNLFKKWFLKEQINCDDDLIILEQDKIKIYDFVVSLVGGDNIKNIIIDDDDYFEIDFIIIFHENYYNNNYEKYIGKSYCCSYLMSIPEPFKKINDFVEKFIKLNCKSDHLIKHRVNVKSTTEKKISEIIFKNSKEFEIQEFNNKVEQFKKDNEQ